MHNDRDTQVVDKSKLTQRELLILLSDNMDDVKSEIKMLKSDYPGLRERIVKVETKLYIIPVVISLLIGCITLIINLINTVTK